MISRWSALALQMLQGRFKPLESRLVRGYTPFLAEPKIRKVENPIQMRLELRAPIKWPFHIVYVVSNARAWLILMLCIRGRKDPVVPLQSLCEEASSLCPHLDLTISMLYVFLGDLSQFEGFFPSIHRGIYCRCDLRDLDDSAG